MIILFIAFMLVGWAVQSKLKSKFKKYSATPLSNGMSGKEVAEKMLADHGITKVRVISTPGKLTDHYNPKDMTVNLSPDVYEGRNISAAAVAALAAASAGMAGSLPPSVSCTVELATFPAAGDTTGQGETGPTVHRTLSLATLASFDALHCTLASIAGAPPPVGGRYNPSTLQVAYTDEHGVPRVLGGETWPVFMASARTLHARILVTKETLAAASPAAAQPVPSTTLATPAAPPQLPPGTMFNPFMMAMMSGGNPAGAAGLPTFRCALLAWLVCGRA